ncbi:kinase-like domain-containing protein [Rhizophagus clarus]|uniref:Kinase-like domain-containing protein n=1 Tax=Rhizophagus clarus TaxID=94130 RepID=A0A8H3R6G3_9GLOM|nr:kinase-like domain-containing protein [Rhizophagus clarus]
MSDDHETKNTKEWINWIEESIVKEHIKFYEYKQFKDYDNNINYMLVMEYADGNNLRSYLKNNFSKLTWDNKYLMAYQHTGNILVHQNTIKLADLDYQKESEYHLIFNRDSSYVNPKSFNKQENNNNQTQLHLLNEK